MEDTAVAQVLVEHQILSSDRGAEHKTNRDVTNRMSSGVVSNDNPHTHNSRGKFVNVTASLRVIRELIDALLDDKFDFERGEIARKGPAENKATEHRNTYHFYKHNPSQSSARHDKLSDSEKIHGKEVQQQQMAYKDIPHKSFDGNKRVNVISPSLREGRHGRFPISRTRRSFSAKSQTSPSELQVPAKYKRTWHHSEKHHKPDDLQSYVCRTHISTNNNNRNGDLCRKESIRNQEFVIGDDNDLPESMKVCDAESPSVKRCKLLEESIGLGSSSSSLIGQMKPSLKFTISPSTMTSDASERHPSRKEENLARRVPTKIRDVGMDEGHMRKDTCLPILAYLKKNVKNFMDRVAIPSHILQEEAVEEVLD
ncbi:hypothetical protein HOLleu_12503 [Holothuria leucospilota]|uniref:Uncharacterized protein n=1 Tax=Holothuria leucospilota TaxID=206669 RepID=A0A9Q1CB96_HOLLE|nr:hypothetical protein HOLleu_12503 [Holothuria leucospilota]